MNSTIRNIANDTTNMKILDLARKIIKPSNGLFRAVFMKKNGELRTMVFTASVNWNALNGIDTTVSGAKMVANKVKNGMATVCEKLENGKFQCRTLPLGRVVSLEAL